MKTIRGSSWHYKYVAKRWTEDPESLCWYFWKIVLSMIGMTAVGAGAALLVLVALIAVAFPIWQWFFVDYNPELQVGALVLWAAIGAVVSIKYRTYLYDIEQLKRKTKVYKEPGLVSQFLYAQHRKVCPLLEYKRKE